MSLVTNKDASEPTKNILVCGAGGFIGSHLCEHLMSLGHKVVGADLKYPLYKPHNIFHKFHQVDLRHWQAVNEIFLEGYEGQKFDEVYQLAADMGGAGYIFVGENDADIMHNSAKINLNILEIMHQHEVKKVFYSSSACMYPQDNQTDPDNPDLAEATAYPANPDSDYGWEKLFSERLYQAYSRCYGIDVRIARFHNIFGPCGSWDNGKEKAPAALCRKVAKAQNEGVVDVWGPGNQTRSFLFIDECVEGMLRIMESDCQEPLNLGSTRKVTINQLVEIIAKIAEKTIYINNIEGPVGVMGRTSDNNLIKEKIDWAPDEDLESGLKATYEWIVRQIENNQIDV